MYGKIMLSSIFFKMYRKLSPIKMKINPFNKKIITSQRLLELFFKFSGKTLLLKRAIAKPKITTAITPETCKCSATRYVTNGIKSMKLTVTLIFFRTFPRIKARIFPLQNQLKIRHQVKG